VQFFITKKPGKNKLQFMKKKGKYVVSKIDSTGNVELNEPISKEEAEKRFGERIKEIRKFY